MWKPYLAAALALLFLGSFPVWPYARRWGYVPSGILGLLLIVALLLLLL